MKKITAKIASVFGLAAALFLGGNAALAAPSSTPTEVIDGVVGATIDESVSLLQYVIDNYLGYILALIVVGILYGLFKRFVHIGK